MKIPYALRSWILKSTSFLELIAEIFRRNFTRLMQSKKQFFHLEVALMIELSGPNSAWITRYGPLRTGRPRLVAAVVG